MKMKSLNQRDVNTKTDNSSKSFLDGPPYKLYDCPQKSILFEITKDWPYTLIFFLWRAVVRDDIRRFNLPVAVGADEWNKYQEKLTKIRKGKKVYNLLKPVEYNKAYHAHPNIFKESGLGKEGKTFFKDLDEFGLVNHLLHEMKANPTVFKDPNDFMVYFRKKYIILVQKDPENIFRKKPKRKKVTSRLASNAVVNEKENNHIFRDISPIINEDELEVNKFIFPHLKSIFDRIKEKIIISELEHRSKNLSSCITGLLQKELDHFIGLNYNAQINLGVLCTVKQEIIDRNVRPIADEIRLFLDFNKKITDKLRSIIEEIYYQQDGNVNNEKVYAEILTLLIQRLNRDFPNTDFNKEVIKDHLKRYLNKILPSQIGDIKFQILDNFTQYIERDERNLVEKLTQYKIKKENQIREKELNQKEIQNHRRNLILDFQNQLKADLLEIQYTFNSRKIRREVLLNLIEDKFRLYLGTKGLEKECDLTAEYAQFIMILFPKQEVYRTNHLHELIQRNENTLKYHINYLVHQEQMSQSDSNDEDQQSNCFYYHDINLVDIRIGRFLKDFIKSNWSKNDFLNKLTLCDLFQDFSIVKTEYELNELFLTLASVASEFLSFKSRCILMNKFATWNKIYQKKVSATAPRMVNNMILEKNPSGKNYPIKNYKDLRHKLYLLTKARKIRYFSYLDMIKEINKDLFDKRRNIIEYHKIVSLVLSACKDVFEKRDIVLLVTETLDTFFH